MVGGQPQYVGRVNKKEEKSMPSVLNAAKKIVWSITVCCSVSCCGILIETDKGTFELSDDVRDIRENNKNSNRMNQQAEDKNIAETKKNIEKQNQSEDAARTKRVNELIEKGLRSP